MAIPLRDELLVPYVTNWNTRLATGYAIYGLSEEQATHFTELYTPYQTVYTAMMTARGAGTRSKSQTASKDTSKKALLAYARQLYAFVQANAAVTDSSKALLGVEVRTNRPSPIPAPTVRPMVAMTSAIARTVTISVYDPAGKTRRGKLPTAVCANVYSFVGTTYPSDPTLWQFCGAATKPNFQIAFPDSVPNGAQVWICAAWMTRRGDVGPVSVPISTNVQGGGQQEQTAGIKLAA